ncbi:MAG TPA: ATP-binding protein, partial [Polyangiaceae bacterium]|nr:ATP-binding protein [Polyangiaceae bacterium]
AMTLRELTPRARLVREFGECPEVLADDTRITQVFVNLLVNAAHAIAPGRSESNEVRVVTGTFTDGTAYVEIRDTGCGIPKNVIPRVFEPFFTTRALETGTGLGLSVSHGIVQSLRGSIEVESTVGAGSTFRVVLPAADGTKSVPPLQKNSSLRPPALNTTRVLLIDDERILLESLARTLEERYAVTTSTSARSALTLLENGESFDLIISDLMMPGMTGMEFYRELERRFPQQSARTVFMTGGAFTPGAQQFLSEVRRRLLEKPFSNSQLLSFIAASVHDVSRA